MAYSLTYNEFLCNRTEKDNLEGLIKEKMSITWTQHLPMQRNGWFKNGFVVQNLDTSNKSVVKNPKTIDKDLHILPKLVAMKVMSHIPCYG